MNFTDLDVKAAYEAPWMVSRFHNLNVLKLEMLDAVNGNSWHCSFKELKCYIVYARWTPHDDVRGPIAI